MARNAGDAFTASFGEYGKPSIPGNLIHISLLYCYFQTTISHHNGSQLKGATIVEKKSTSDCLCDAPVLAIHKRAQPETGGYIWDNYCWITVIMLVLQPLHWTSWASKHRSHAYNYHHFHTLPHFCLEDDYWASSQNISIVQVHNHLLAV